MKPQLLVYFIPILIGMLFAGFEWLFYLINRLKRIHYKIQLISFGNYLRCSLRNKAKPWEPEKSSELVRPTFWLQLGIVITVLTLMLVLFCLCVDFAVLRSWRINKHL